MKGTISSDAALSVPASLRLLGLLYGGVCYLIFLVVFLYTIGFVGNLLVPKSIDTPEQASLAESLTVDLVLLSLFAVQHSVMARPRFKRWWTQIVPTPIERSTYVLASSLILALLFWQWHPLTDVVWEMKQPAIVFALWGLFIGGWLMVLISTFLIDHSDLFGLRQAFFFATDKPYSPPSFRTPALYRIVRHPIMLGFIVSFWSTPVMTWGHLAFAGMATAYIIVGICLEERDLRRAFGSDYEAYREQVSMIWPWVRKGAKLSRTRSG
jgi:protein-S-isoprenylcysteine O-methyltransferase Ste14